MLTNADLAVLNEAYRSSRKGVETINTVISKVYDDDLALEDKAAEEIRKASERPEGASAVEKAASWTALQAGTLLNTSTGHVAELMIEGNAKGITDLMKTVKKNQEAKREYCELAEELMDFEEKNIECLKNYLDE